MLSRRRRAQERPPLLGRGAGGAGLDEATHGASSARRRAHLVGMPCSRRVTPWGVAPTRTLRARSTGLAKEILGGENDLHEDMSDKQRRMCYDALCKVPPPLPPPHRHQRAQERALHWLHARPCRTPSLIMQISKIKLPWISTAPATTALAVPPTQSPAEPAAGRAPRSC